MKGIITADWHLRKDPPRCRLDEDWWGTQAQVVEFIRDEAEKRKCPIYITGDIFHRSVVVIEILDWLIDCLEFVTVYIIPGQHDLPYHSIKNIHQSSYGVLRHYFRDLTTDKEHSNTRAFPFGKEIKTDAEIVFTHQYIYEDETKAIFINKKPIGKSAEELLKEYPKAKWIFTGDNHHNFEFQNGSPGHYRHVINPGCITRQAADMKDYKPVIYYVDTELGHIEPIPLPDTEPLVTDQYIQDEQARNDRIESFISTIQKQGKVSLNFMDNLREKARSLKGEDRKMLDEIIEEVV